MTDRPKRLDGTGIY